MTDYRHYDVIIIGTGAGGGTLAHRLAPTSKQLLLERGGYLPRERDNWNSTAVFVKGKYRAPEFWYDADGDEFPARGPGHALRRGQHQVLRAQGCRSAPQDFGSCATGSASTPALGRST